MFRMLFNSQQYTDYSNYKRISVYDAQLHEDYWRLVEKKLLKMLY